MTQNYFQGSSLAIVVFDVTNSKSFQDVAKWIDMVRNHTYHDLSLFVVGNKTDLISEYIVRTPVDGRSPRRMRGN